ncbi:cytochrome b-c1 complex subunit 10 [Saccoglossus kowalevskii]|uniref:Cytochrome b-c1 complex subunit 10 n=1 Tax=Saccoglossus kowalevskii TaxID=10224 RepID=A0ABM0GH02_SACKO|nr:cytochrome b-c1 complex subunit 10 [Saccoglossus kowalevskii]
MLGRLIKPRYLELANSWKAVGLTWFGAGAISLVWLCDWQAVMGYVPYVKDKYIKEEGEES